MAPNRLPRAPLIAFAALVAHLPALAGGFIWLDHAHLEAGGALAQHSGWLELFTQGFAGTGFYRPLMSLSLSLEHALGGAAWLHHATNLLLHAAVAVLVAECAELFCLGTGAAWIAGLTFAVHPVTSLVAGAIAFRSEAMVALFLLGLLLFHARGRPVAAALCVIGAALSKETGLLLAPLFVVALELSSATRPQGGGMSSRGRLFLSEAAAFAVVVGLRVAFAPEFRATFPELAANEALGTRLAALTKSVATLLFLTPFDRSVCDSFPVTGLTGPTSLAGALLAFTLLHLAWTQRGTFLLLAISLLPSLSIAPLSRFWSPHYLYVPLAFTALLLAEAIAAAPRLRPLLYVVLPLLSLVSFVDAFRFRSDSSLFSREVLVQPACREAHFYLGEVARSERRFAEARDHYALALAPERRVLAYVDRKAALANLGVTELELGNPAAARSAFLTALSLERAELESRRLRHNAALAALLEGDADAAARELETEAQRADALPESVAVYRAALAKLGR